MLVNALRSGTGSLPIIGDLKAGRLVRISVRQCYQQFRKFCVASAQGVTSHQIETTGALALVLRIRHPVSPPGFQSVIRKN
jgi:hypothetical protein